jgi:hypothetical protein
MTLNNRHIRNEGDSMTTDTDAHPEIQRPFLALVSKLLVGEKPCPVRFMYKTVPVNIKDTGWRMFSGYEDPEFLADAQNMQPYPVETLTKMDASLEPLFETPGPGIVWERIPGGNWERVHDFEIPVEEDIATTCTNDLDDLGAQGTP